MRIRRDNKGMSLVELMVAIGILSVIMVAVGWILSSMSKSFGNSQKEVALQDNVQTTYSLLSNLIKESQSVSDVKTIANNKYPNTPVWSDSANRYYIAAETATRESGVKGATDDAVAYIVDYDTNTKTLYLGQTIYNPNEVLNGSTINATKYADVFTDVNIRTDANLLARYVESFSVDISNVVKGYVVLSIKLKNGDREAEINQNVYLRNSGLSIWTDGSTPETTPSPSATEEASPTPTVITPSITPESNKATLCNDGGMENPFVDQIKRENDIYVGYDPITTASTILSTVKNMEGQWKTIKIDVEDYKKEEMVDTDIVESYKYMGAPIDTHKVYMEEDWTKINSTRCYPNRYLKFLIKTEWSGTVALLEERYVDEATYNTLAQQYNSNGYVEDYKDYDIVAKLNTLADVTKIYHQEKQWVTYYKQQDKDVWEQTGTDYKNVTVTGSSDGRLIIRNDSTQLEYSDIVVTVYFEKGIQFKELSSGSNQFLSINQSLTTAKGVVNYQYSKPTNGNCDYIKIRIPALKKAVVDANGKATYDTYVFDYKTSANVTSEVACVYTSTGTGHN